ncbi:hypothetical protein AGR1C_Lc20013 [Agrobacterium fabacearum TT111]|nr:hypothetical protein AGR1C_Lc20013 [Agrobacterium fabacearum TT111]
MTGMQQLKARRLYIPGWSGSRLMRIGFRHLF